MAERPQGPRLTPEAEPATRRRLRRSILVVVSVFAAYGIVTSLSDRAPGWATMGREDFPAGLRELAFADGALAAGKPYVIRIRRTGRKRALPPRRMALSVVAETRATYRCDRRTRCPWIRVAPLACSLDAAPTVSCGFELFEFGRTGIKILPRRRCRLTRPGIRDLDVPCPRGLVLGRKLAPLPATRPAKRPAAKPAPKATD